MTPGKRIIIIIQSIIICLLVYFLLKPYFKAQNRTRNSTENTVIRINPLNIINESPAHDTVPRLASTSSLPNSDDNHLKGQTLEPALAHSLQIKMYVDRNFLYEKYSFDPSEKIFLVMEFDQLEAGDHNLSVRWKAPNGQVINTSRHTISLTRLSPRHRSYFWLKLMKNGVFTEMLTGDKYKGDIHGRWDAEIYINGARLTTQHFMIFE